MYCSKTNHFNVIHHFKYSELKKELNFTAPDVCLSSALMRALAASQQNVL